MPQQYNLYFPKKKIYVLAFEKAVFEAENTNAFLTYSLLIVKRQLVCYAKIRKMLKKVNFFLSSLLPQKVYWHLAGLVHPWEAVVENVNNPKDLYQQGKNVVRLLEKLRLINRESRVLDIGCGVGRVEYALAGSVERCVGIDIAPSMIKLARKNVKAKNVTFLTTNGDSLNEVKNEKFDLVFSLLVFQHLSRRIFQKYVKEASQILAKGGKLFFILARGGANEKVPLDDILCDKICE